MQKYKNTTRKILKKIQNNTNKYQKYKKYNNTKKIPHKNI